MLRTMLTTVAALFLVFAATAAIADDAGKIVSLEGTVEIGRAGSFTQATTGSVIQPGDTVRTGTPGRVRILFIDDSVLNIGDGSTLVIDETVFDASKGAASTLMHLLGGKVRALVSEYYSGGKGTYQIETPTAVSGVRGTEFIVTYDNKAQLSQILGLGGLVAVNGTIDRKNHGVLVRAMEITDVAKGKYPTPPRQITTDDETYKHLLDGLDMPGGGLPETLLQEEPAFGGQVVKPSDSADGNVQNPLDPAAGLTGDAPDAELLPSDPGHTGGDLLGQPQPVLDAPTDVDVHF